MIEVREAKEADVEQIRQVFLAIYGQDYSHPQFYDTQLIKKMLYSDDTILVVAVDTENGQILGTASVLLEMGAHSDLLGEFGRLAVHPDARRRGVGKLLMKGRLERLTYRLHLALVEPRAVHPFAQKIALTYGFASVGFQPMKLLLARRESLNVFVRYFGDALKLRKNNPHIIPEVYPLAKLALENCGLTSDPVVEADPGTYPYDDRFQLDELTDDGYATLLHFQRGRVTHREIFGPVRLHHGLFRIRALQSNYLLARENGQIVGAVGFSVDQVEKTLRIFELITLSERPVRFLLSEMLRTCIPLWGIEYMEVDVSAYAPRMQRTLLELGFLPAAYIPAMVFHEVERLDGIRMVRILLKPEHEGLDLLPESQAIASLVLRGFIDRNVIPKIARAVPQISLFAGMNDEQIRQVAGRCTLKTFPPGEQIIRENEAGEETFIVLEGEASISTGRSATQVGTVGASECLGEMSYLAHARHSATATSQTKTETAVLPHRELDNLIRLRPDIGVIIYRNLATGLGKKLIRSDKR
jgi:GNAT superfamily N-acetyltransferase